ncbi:MAG: PEPxxWA-CTERM sorting domain-containing protein [Sphingomonas bacterium]
MLLDLVSRGWLAVPVLAAGMLGAPQAHADNEQYQLYARSCSPYITGGCDAQTSREPLSDGLNIGGGYSFGSGYNGGVALASAIFNPGAPPLLQEGNYENAAIGWMSYTFQVRGTPDTLVPLHMAGYVSVSPVHLSDDGGNPAHLTDLVNDTPPNNHFLKIAGAADVGISLTRGTPYADNGAHAAIEAVYNPRSYYYCNGCGGGGDSFDKTIWVYSNSDIQVVLNTSALVQYYSDGAGDAPFPTFGTISARADPVFSIDDPAYAGFSIVGLPTGAPPPSAGAVPEPVSWAMMVAGFGLVGGTMRRRRRRPERAGAAC